MADVRAAATGEGVQAARAAGLRIAERATVLATSGWRGVRSVTLGTVAADGTIGRGQTVACDTLLMSGG